MQCFNKYIYLMSEKNVMLSYHHADNVNRIKSILACEVYKTLQVKIAYILKKIDLLKTFLKHEQSTSLYLNISVEISLILINRKTQVSHQMNLK